MRKTEVLARNSQLLICEPNNHVKLCKTQDYVNSSRRRDAQKLLVQYKTGCGETKDAAQICKFWKGRLSAVVKFSGEKLTIQGIIILF